MTKGKIVNKQTGLEIPAEESRGYPNYFFATIEGDTMPRIWYTPVWDFIEDKPSAYEQFLSFKPGQRFAIWDDDVVRIKLDNSTYAAHYEDGSWEILFKLNPNWFNKSDTLEAIDE